MDIAKHLLISAAEWWQFVSLLFIRISSDAAGLISVSNSVACSLGGRAQIVWSGGTVAEAFDLLRQALGCLG